MPGRGGPGTRPNRRTVDDARWSAACSWAWLKCVSYQSYHNPMHNPHRSSCTLYTGSPARCAVPSNPISHLSRRGRARRGLVASRSCETCARRRATSAPRSVNYCSTSDQGISTDHRHRFTVFHDPSDHVSGRGAVGFEFKANPFLTGDRGRCGKRYRPVTCDVWCVKPG